MSLRPFAFRPCCARGQATVELVALLPVVVLLGAGAWQLAVAGHAIWSASAAARAASRVAAVGAGSADTSARAGSAGRRAPRDVARVVRRIAGARASVRLSSDGGVRVTVPIPAVVVGGDVTTFTTTARFAPQR